MNYRVNLLILFFYITTTFVNANDNYKQNQTHLDIVISLISSMSDTINSLQEERGASCVYISSNGKKFDKKLKSIIRKSDKKIKILNSIINNNQNIFEKYFSKEQSKALFNTFDQLYKTRDEVKILKSDFTKSYSKYTQTISFMLMNISNITDMFENEELNNKLYLYSIIHMNKESLSQKRAALCSLFSNVNFSKNIFEYYFTADTTEKIYLKSFLHNADSKMENLYFKTMDDITLEKVEEFEKLALKILSGDKVFANSKDWSKSIGKKIELIQTIENKIFEDIMLIVDKINSNSLITLTKEEKKWMKNNPMVKIAVMNYWVADDDGNSIHTDILKLINKYSNLNIMPVRYDAWKDGFSSASVGKDIHGIMNLSWSKEREKKYFNYTKAYNFTPHYLIVKKENKDIHSLSDLKENTIYLKTKSITHKIIEDVSKTTKVIDLLTEEDMYKKLSTTNEAVAMILYNINQAKLDKYNLKVVETIYNKYSEVSLGINKKYNELTSIINKAYSVIPKEKITQLRDKDYSKKETSLNLTKEEISWIKNHPIITVGGEMDWAPFDFVDESGAYTGLAKDYFEVITNLTGLKFKYDIGKNWTELIDALKNGEIDMLPALYINEDRKKYANFTTSYLSLPEYFFTRVDSPEINHMKDLKGKIVAAAKGYAIIDWIKENHPEVKIIVKPTILDCLKSVESKESDVFIGDNPSTTFVIENNLLTNIKINNTVNSRNTAKIYMATKKEYKILANILTKALNNITRQQKREIASRWMSIVNKTTINFTEEEQKLLDRKQSLTYVYNPDWAPFEWTNELGKHSGIIPDVLSLISSKTNIEFIPISTKSWKESVRKMENNEVNMYSAVVENEERKKYAQFTTKKIYSTPAVLVTRVDDDTVYIDIKNALENKRVAIVKGNGLENYIRTTYPMLNLQILNSTKEGFDSLNDEKIDIFIVNASTAQYFIKKKGYSDIRIATKIDFNFDLKMAIQKSMPTEIISILDKAISDISEKELSDIYYKWTEVTIQKETDWLLVGQVSGIIFLGLVVVLLSNYKLKTTVEKKTADIENQKNELENLVASFEKNVIFSHTDLNGIITHVSEAFCEISGYSKDELLGKPHSMLRHPDMPNEVFIELWDLLQKQSCFKTDIKNLKKDGSYYWLESKFEPIYDNKNNHIGYSALRVDITNKKEVEELTVNLEKQVEEQTKDLKEQFEVIEKAQYETEQILSNILLPVLITSKENRKVLYANKYAQRQYEMPLNKIIGRSIDDVYTVENQQQYIIEEIEKKGFVENLEQTFKKSNGKEFTALLSVTPITYHDVDSYIGMVTDISKQKIIENEVRTVHKQTRDSIEYAALIQGALIPDNNLLGNYFKDYFVIWHPKDTVGGDIYLFNELRNDDECLLMYIDCTGHGVPGAFVTMLVKAVEREIVSIIKNNKDMEVSPAWIMRYFNRTMKILLKQETKNSLSNVGWDGGIIYYNRKQQILKFAGAETPLFYIDTDGTFNTIKGNRYSVGYKKCDMDYEYKETIIEVEEGMKFYCTTDGYLDQNGGEKDFPFGKKRFGNIIKDYHTYSMFEQEEIFLYEMNRYENMIVNNDRNDDMTVISFEIKEPSTSPDIILEYDGVLTQGIITHCMDILEHNISNIGILGNISTMAIELTQNMMKYSKSKDTVCRDIRPAGLIYVEKTDDDKYYLRSKNIISIEDKDKIEPKLLEIQALDQDGVKKRYRELRRSGENTHEHGGGIGFYEIAKFAQSIEYNFKAINKEKFSFEFSAVVVARKKEKTKV